MSFLQSLINAFPGAVGQGLIWGIMAIGVYVTYRLLDVADLTVDGTLCTDDPREIERLLKQGYKIKELPVAKEETKLPKKEVKKNGRKRKASTQRDI